MKRRIAVLLTAVLLSGCAGVGNRVTIEKREYETDLAVVEVETPVFSGIEDTEFAKRLETEIAEEAEACLGRFTEETAERTGAEKSTLRITQTVMCDRKNFISLVSTCNVFTDSVHGTADRTARNIDLQQGRVLVLADLFLDAGYAKKLQGEIDRILEEKPEEYSDLWEKPILGEQQEQCFYLQDGELVLFYPPYELSYYARGFVEFRIPLQNLSGYLQPAYMELA